MKLKTFGITATSLLLVASTAFAAEFIKPDDDGNGSINLPASETHHNLHTAGGSVTVESTTTGDLFAAGGAIKINGNVGTDLFVAGGSIDVNGTVGQNAKIAGGSISVTKPITQDLMIAGGSINVGTGATVGGDLDIAGGSIDVNGPVTGNVRIAGGMVTINSKIVGTLNVRADSGLTFGPNAEVAGKIIYKGPKEAVVKEGAKVNAIEFTRVASKNFGHKVQRFLTIAALLKLLALFAAGWLLNYFFPGKVNTILYKVYDNPWPSLGIGVLAIIATPIIALILLISVIGFYVGLILMALYFLLILFAGLTSPFFVGALIMKWYNKSPILASWRTLLLGLVISTIIVWIPILGALVLGVVFLMNLGALVTKLKPTRTREVSPIA